MSIKKNNNILKTSISDNNNYRQICNLAYKDDNIFKNFKNNQTYKEILEHTTYEQGKMYYDIIKNNNPNLLNQEIIEKVICNDDVGNPNKYSYGNIFISPSTLRYLKVISDLINKYNDLNDKDIIEIGVGYGGQSLLINKLFNIKSYTLVDLDEVLNLSRKYLSNFNFDNLLFYNQFELPEKEYDLVISNYAFSECTKETQDIYIDKILNSSEHGYMTNNNISHIFNVMSYSSSELKLIIDDDVEISNEAPLTHKDNYMLTW